MITAGRVMNGAASPGQHVWTGSTPRSTSSPRSTTSWQAPLRTVLGQRVGDRLELPEPAQLVDEALGRLHLEHVGELRADVVEPLDAEGEAHAPLGAELVDEQRVPAPVGPLEQQRRPAGLDGAVDDLRHLEVRVDLGGDADELALALEQRDPRAQVGRRGHGVSTSSARRRLARGGDDRPSRARRAPITARKTRPTISMPRMMCMPSLAASKITAGSYRRPAPDQREAGARSAAATSSPVGLAAERARRGDPRLAVAGLAGRAERRTARDQLGHRATASTPPASAIRTRPCA